jgi:transposase
MASLEPNAVVSEVARRFDVTRQQVYDWRRAARRGELGAPGGVLGFLEVVAGLPTNGPASATGAMPITEAADSATSAVNATVTRTVMVEIGLAGGRLLRVPAGLPTGEVRRLIGAVEGA